MLYAYNIKHFPKRFTGSLLEITHKLRGLGYDKLLMNTQCDFIKVDTLSFQALPSDENHPNKNLRDSRLSGIRL